MCGSMTFTKSFTCRPPQGPPYHFTLNVTCAHVGVSGVLATEEMACPPFSVDSYQAQRIPTRLAGWLYLAGRPSDTMLFTRSARARQLVKPGLSMPYKLMSPGTPWPRWSYATRGGGGS